MSPRGFTVVRANPPSSLSNPHLLPSFERLADGVETGHYERKMKHLQNQKESKKKMKMVGNVELPQEAFFSILGNKK